MNYCMNLEETLERLMRDKLRQRRHQFNLYTEKLKLLSPLYRLSGGYSYVRNDNNEAIRSVSMVSAGDDIKITVADGEFGATVNSIEPKEIG